MNPSESTNFLYVIPCKDHGHAHCCCLSVKLAKIEAAKQCAEIADEHKLNGKGAMVWTGCARSIHESILRYIAQLENELEGKSDAT